MSETFRESRFIDFNQGIVKESPKDFRTRIPEPWHLKDKVEIFECRVEVWQLGVAVEVLKEIETHHPPSIWSHAAYGLISVAFSYFEMIGKSINPKSKTKGTANLDFNYGFCDVYEEYRPTTSNYDDKNLPEVKEFRDRARNGMYHLAYTKRGLGIHNDDSIATKDFYIDDSGAAGIPRVYWVNPHRMVRTMVNHFPTLIARLNNPDPNFDVMRKKFKEFFDEFHNPQS